MATIKKSAAFMKKHPGLVKAWRKLGHRVSTTSSPAKSKKPASKKKSNKKSNPGGKSMANGNKKQSIYWGEILGFLWHLKNVNSGYREAVDVNGHTPENAAILTFTGVNMIAVDSVTDWKTTGWKRALRTYFPLGVGHGYHKGVGTKGLRLNRFLPWWGRV